MELPYTIEPPAVDQGWNVAYLVAGIIIVSIIFYLLTKLKYKKFLKLWFSGAILIGLSVSLSVFIGDIMGLVIAFVLTVLRLTNRDIYIHNLTEVLLYGGIVSIFSPLFNPLSAFILLIIISVYDYISVYVTKHMIVLAKTQASANLFTGLVVERQGDTAILGGGDIAFSLLFASVLGSAFGMIYAYITIYFVLAALSFLTILGQRGKFYPAMPFITIACTLSYATVLII